jgi:hypothetical protein
MKRVLLLLVSLGGLVLPVCSCLAESEPLFFFYDPYQDSLARRDEYGLYHQSPQLYPTDFAPRHSVRLAYYFESGERLAHDPAYVGALQFALYKNGYYCGPIDGVFSDRVADAIARLQKNSWLHVTGTITVGVRRVLHLP